MPKSRKRPRPKRRRTKVKLDPLTLERMLQQIVNAPDAAPPPVVYHYTTWTAAQGILASQEFWATAHDCMKDKAELGSANDVIVEVANDLRKNATGMPAEALALFASGYLAKQVKEVISVCLACFSAARDGDAQWRTYGDYGNGVCLGIKTLKEPGPQDPPSVLFKVDYSESSWRCVIKKKFQAICSLLSRAEALPSTLKLGRWALYQSAAFAAIVAKESKWEVEQEFRQVTLVPHGVQLKKRSVGGEEKKYWPAVARAGGKRISLSEIIIGSNRNAHDTREQLERVLAAQGYEDADAEYPEITVSAILPWSVSKS
jgi:hypothetical protein